MLWTLLIGLVVGALAKWLMPGRDPGGILMTMFLGIAGSFTAGFLGRIVGWYSPGEGAGLVASILGAMLVLWMYRKYVGGSAASV